MQKCCFLQHTGAECATMSIIYKLTLSLFALSLLVFGIYGTYQLRTEAQDLRDDVEQETRLLTYSLLISVGNALRDRQTEDVQELLQQIERLKPSIDVRIYIQNRTVIRSGAESLAWPEEVEQTLQQTALDGEMKQYYFPDDEPDFLILSLPFNKTSTSLQGNLAVVRSLQKMKEDLSKTKTYILWSFFSFVLFTSLLCFFLGHVYISRPLQKLRQAMQAFRNSTEPPEPLPVKGKDELSSVTQEFNRMTAELFSAYRRLDAEMQQGRQLQRALQEADKLITIGQLSAGLAHEIGSPLQIVNGRARALANCAEHPDDVRRLAEILVVQTDRITRIVQRLLEFARRSPPERVHCDVAVAIAEVLDMLRYEVRRRGIELSFTHPEQLPFMLTNRDGVQQIVLNLIGNALASIPDAGTITVDLSEAPLTRAIETVPALRLSVTDSGKGIAPEHVSQLFEPFFTTRGGQGGTGLGLAVVKAIITELRGTVVVESQPDKGSCFIVHLPLKETI
ncbi:phospho-acceptor domain-containing protein [Methylobacter tundripaludum]|uniref:histidine kinase n=2 Tax=Methylobacter tundripaludum TaxID=173365 RepID=A0A2S6H8S7_9GAMM|nr:phospho-acceptor domain-containing protein [Methylobacter tundripaludum]